jgi:hypothetical protein
MRKIFITLSMVFALNAYVFAQSDYRPGFVIKPNNDTVYGFIGFKGDISHSRSCSFKPNKEGQAVEYGPEEIASYRFRDDKFYVSKEITINGVKEIKFLEFLLNGAVQLYCYRSAYDVYFYIQKEGGDLMELRETDFVSEVDGKTYFTEDKKYIGKLKYIFAETPELQQKIEQVTIDRKSLIDISTEYHDLVCTGNKCVVYKKKLPGLKMRIGPVIGYDQLSLNQLDFPISVVGVFGNFESDFDKSGSLCYGLLANIPLPYTNGKFELQYEGLVTSHTFISTVWTSYKNVKIEHDYSIRSTDLSHYIYFRYNVLKWKLHPTVQIGGYLVHKLKFATTGFTQDGYITKPFPTDAYFGFSLGAGLAYRYRENGEVYLNIAYNKGYGSYTRFNPDELNITLGIPVFNIN